MAYTKKLKFLHHAADIHLRGKNVAVYADNSDDNARVLVAETVNGKIISQFLRITKAEYAELRDKWTDGGRLADNDAVVAKRALDSMSTYTNSNIDIYAI